MTHRGVPIVGLVGYSGSGKTTLIKRLVPILRERGMRVGYLKHAHHRFDIDHPGKDSYEIRAAGADQVLIASAERWALQAVQTEPGRDPSLTAMIDRFDAEALDLVIVEGFKHAAYPKIEVHRGATGQPPLYPEDEDIVAVATDSPLNLSRALTVLSLDDAAAIGDFVVSLARRSAATDARADLIRHLGRLRREGLDGADLAIGSVRSGDGFWITRVERDDGHRIGDLVSWRIDGPQPEDMPEEARHHRAIYNHQPKVRVVLHSYGAYALTMSLLGQDFSPADHLGKSTFGTVPVLALDDDKHAERLAQAFDQHQVVLVHGRGLFACAESVAAAYRSTCLLELSAKTYVAARQVASL